VASVARFGRGGDACALSSVSERLPMPARSGIDHVVVVMMENRSFDHLLGWLPGADAREAGLTYVDGTGVAHETYPLAPRFDGCDHPDPEHSYAAARVEYNHGACDGFLKTGSNDLLPIGYFRRADLPFLGEAAVAWTVCDRYFAALLGPTYPNRLYLHAGVTDRLDDTLSLVGLPTIWDRLAAKGLRGGYYFGNVPFIALFGGRYNAISHSHAAFFAQCRSGRLPQVCFVDPAFTVPGLVIGTDDHPPADIRAGETFLNSVYRAVISSPAWPRTLLVITFDEWGGFFDHVPPPPAPDVKPDYMQRGFRVPCLLVSPYARRGHVAHTLYDHTSILKLIEWRWNLKPLSVRDAHANNLAGALDLGRPNLQAPRFVVPRVVAGAPC
jgi:phospholipase C